MSSSVLSEECSTLSNSVHNVGGVDDIIQFLSLDGKKTVSSQGFHSVAVETLCKSVQSLNEQFFLQKN